VAAAAAIARRRRRQRAGVLLLVAAVLAGCGSTPGDRAGAGQRDGPPANPPADLIDRPDAEPRVEPIRTGGPNKPYVVLGQAYTPVAADQAMVETGLASWYGRGFDGRPTASGETYDMYGMSAAHRTMPIPSYALVRNPANGREVVVRINDRGPFHRDRVIDLSYAAALKLDVLRGLAPVQVQRLTNEDIRTGRWRSDAPPPQVAEAVAPLPGEVAARPPAASDASAAPAGPAVAAADLPGYWVQLGAFRQRQGADDLRRQLMRELAWLEPWLAVFDDRTLFRVQAGPFGSRGEALGAAERIRGAARLQPLVVQRR
jgi:rare lipoprotein A